MADKKFIIEVRTAGFRKANKDLETVTKSTRRYQKSTNDAKNTNKDLIGSLGALRNKILVYTFAIGGAVGAMNKFISAASGFQDVQTRLVGLTGSVEEAKRAFEVFNEIAATTPFQLQDVVNAGAQLEAFGVDSKATLSAVTDLAAFMGTTATEAASALGRAFAGGAGAADILRERGILQLIKDSQGINDLTKVTLPQFRQALLRAMVDPVAGIQGSSKRLSQTFTGAVSNMNDAITRFAALVGEQMLPALTGATNAVEDFFRQLDLQTLAEFGTAVGIVGGALLVFRSRALLAGSAMALLTGGLKAFAVIAAVFATQQAIQATGAFNNLTTATNTTTTATQNATQATNRYIQSVGQSNIVLSQNLELQKQIDTIMADTVLQVMANNDVSDKRILKAQLLLQAEQNMLESMKGRIIIDREAAIMGNLLIKTAQDATEEEIQFFNALERNLREKLIAIETDKNLIKTNTDLTSTFNVLSSSLRSFTAAQGDNVAQAKILFRTLLNLFALTPSGQPFAAGLTAFGQLIGHTGGLIKDNGIQRFATGGMVQGGQDNVPILAQSGEFIMQRSAVQNIGVQNLAEMNRSGNMGASINVNITGGVVDESYVNNELIPAINKATSLGNRINA
tara:strand:- start:10005 stop:11879 length:1875 start_codon:yes stop_codon:yes gene_type:complete